MEPKTKYCHNCTKDVPSYKALDCCMCGLSCRCFDCIPENMKVNQLDHNSPSYQYLCPQCIRKGRGPIAYYLCKTVENS